MSELSDKIRQQFAESDDRRDQGVTENEQVVSYLNLSYGDDPYQSLNVYRPKSLDTTKALPVLISVHGGGWVYGDKERYHYFCQSLAETDFAVVNFSYRLAPEHQFPSSVEDINAVYHWIEEHADEFGFDLSQVFATGDSAGAHLLSLYTNLQTNPRFANYYHLTLSKLLPKALALFCGAYVIDVESDDLTKGLMADLFKNGGTDEELDLVNVLSYITPAFPQTFVATANQDFLRADSLKLLNVLAQEEIEFEAHCYGSQQMPLKHVFHLNVKTDEGKVAREAMLNYFRRRK